MVFKYIYIHILAAILYIFVFSNIHEHWNIFNILNYGASKQRLKKLQAGEFEKMTEIKQNWLKSDLLSDDRGRRNKGSNVENLSRILERTVTWCHCEKLTNTNDLIALKARSLGDKNSRKNKKRGPIGEITNTKIMKWIVQSQRFSLVNIYFSSQKCTILGRAELRY